MEGSNNVAFAEHWDGTTWTAHLALPGAGYDEFNAIARVSCHGLGKHARGTLAIGGLVAARGHAQVTSDKSARHPASTLSKISGVST